MGSLGFLGMDRIGIGSSASEFAGAGLSINQENMVNQLVQDGRTVFQSRDVLRRVSYLYISWAYLERVEFLWLPKLGHVQVGGSTVLF